MDRSRIALVTGGVKGLGAAAAEALAADGLTVAVTSYRLKDEAQAYARAKSFSYYAWDVSDFDACRDGIARVEHDLGPIDVLVNNAGVTRDAIFHKMTSDQWTAVLRTDLDSMFNMCRHVIGSMRERGHGRIINISSVNALKGQVGQTNYCAAKAGILGFTRALALETARKGVTVNAVAPGYCDTSMVAAVPEEILQKIVARVPVGRLGQPEEIGRVIAFLASERAGFITGATISADGGMRLA